MDAAYKKRFCGQGWEMAGLKYFITAELLRAFTTFYIGTLQGEGALCPMSTCTRQGPLLSWALSVTDAPQITFWETQEHLAPAGVNWILRQEDSEPLQRYQCKQEDGCAPCVVRSSATRLKPSQFRSQDTIRPFGGRYTVVMRIKKVQMNRFAGQ